MQRRYHYLKEKGLHFIGCGVSGGEEGARYGPSMMPGGDIAAWYMCLNGDKRINKEKKREEIAIKMAQFFCFFFVFGRVGHM